MTHQTDDAKKNIYLDEVDATIGNVTASGNVITLKLATPVQVETIACVIGRRCGGKWTNLVRGTDGIVAPTFCEAPLGRDK